MRKIKSEDTSRPTRESTLVSRRILPGVQEREELNALLRVHDPEVAAANRDKITAQHAPLLRQVALEGPTTGGDPATRKQAIAWLGRFAAPEDLNVLVSLAQFDPDAGVRGAALFSLGATGVHLAAPILAAALSSRDAVEAVAGAKALAALADRVGADQVLVSISSIGNARLAKLARKALDAREKAPTGRKRASTRADVASKTGGRPKR